MAKMNMTWRAVKLNEGTARLPYDAVAGEVDHALTFCEVGHAWSTAEMKQRFLQPGLMMLSHFAIRRLG